jgi:glycosyltransferase involved in cell wall biosynthesis
VRSSPRKRGRPAPLDPPPADPEVAELLAAGVFDPEWYAAQTGSEFATPEAAARHYLTRGSGYRSPHPLVDMTSFTDYFIDRLKHERYASTLLEQLRRKSPFRSLGPLFDCRLLEQDPDAVREHPGGVLGWFLEHHGEDAPLPGRSDLTLRDVRPAMIAEARRLVERRRLRGSRTTDTWDQAREDRWRSRWEHAALPATDGPLVTVVMAVRNRAGVVRAAIDSVRAQTLEAWELVVVDDGSTDSTPDVLAEIAATDPRIRVIREEWGGVCVARNRGLSEASAPYVAFLDSDNAWRADFLRLAVTAMAGDGLQAAYAAQSLTDRSVSPPTTRYRAHPGGLGDLMVTNHIDLNVLVVDTALAREIGGFDESLRRWVDHDFAIRLAERTRLHLLPFIAVDYDDSTMVPDRITTQESESWQFVVLGKHWTRWDEVHERLPERVAGRVSVVIPTWNDVKMTVRAVLALLRNTPDTDLEVVVVDNGSRGNIALSLTAALLARPGVRVEHLPRNLNFAIGSNVGLARSTGEYVLFLNNDTEVRPGWLPPLLAALEDPTVRGAQPLLQYPDDAVQACGTVFPVADFPPIHLFSGHPPEDAIRMSDPAFRVVTAAALLMRAADAVALRGFDPIFVNGMEDVDLCLRATEDGGGSFRVVMDSQVTHHESRTPGRTDAMAENRIIFMDRWRGRLPAPEQWRWEERGFRIAHVHGDGAASSAPRPIVVRERLDGSQLPTRSGLRSPAIGGEVGDLWGDTHFLRSLSRALERQAQEPVTHRHRAHSLPATAYDDVAFGIRGLDVIRPQPTKVNVLWVISHPDDVDPKELIGFDLVYAASPSWAADLAARSGGEVRTLLQATDLDLRADLTTPVGDGESPVFVGGNPRERGRPVVDAAVAAGVPLRVHGPFWEGTLPEGVLAGEYVANHDLMQLYRDHGLVLSDHWADMGAHGFLSNRLFDAVASGARVVSEPIDGLELFEGAVQPFRDADELAFLCSPEGRSRFPDDEEMAEIADRVAREHSFDARAEVLVRDVQQVLAAR